MTKTKAMCNGCRNNFYNGNNNLNVSNCWSYKDAKIEWKKRISIHQIPPWNQKPIKILSCYNENGFVFVNKNSIC